ncbi:SIR2 family NAD-dependent protein deacylase [Sulfurospirillum sp. 1612]|uniref:SIR2 family NAD-dependent protein deacylase n=1 Tax=Sulfurospirillum sp. 1612 TaxID=3094835 RepID=UPI002F93E8EF
MSKVIILTGAGVSAESGISTFRDSDGLWEKYRVEDICTVGCLVSNRAQTLDFYDQRRIELKDKKPNHAHTIIAKLKKKYPKEIAVITQNVDNLFEKAGLKADEVVHLHGFLTNLECERCQEVYDVGYQKTAQSFGGKCPICGSDKVRPYIVMFGEAAPNYQLLYRAFDDCEMLVVIGTSGYVINTDMFLNPTIKISILNNLEPSPAINDRLYTKVLYKKASEAIDEIAADVETFLK